MRSELAKRVLRPALVVGISLVSCAAWSQSKQKLERVDAFNATTVLQMAFDDPQRPPDFINLGIVGTAIIKCELTALDGIICLDGNVVRHWPDTDQPGTFINEFSCADPALQLAATNPCTTITVGLSGAIYLAGRITSNDNRLIKVVAKPPTSGCPTGWTQLTLLQGPNYCALALYTGRPAIRSLESIDGDVGAAFKPCPSCALQSGVLSVEDKKNVVFYPDPKTSTTPPIMVANFQAWPFIGNEELLSGAVLQVPNNGVTDSFAVVATTDSRILAKKTSGAGIAFEAYDIPVQRALSPEPPDQCNFDTQIHNVETSSKSERVYVTDRNYCQVIALVPTGEPFVALENDLTLATADTSETNPPIGPTLSPGIHIDLAEDCPVKCDYLLNEEGTPAASFVAVKLNSTQSDVTAFLVEGIADCRMVDEPGFPASLLATCAAAPESVVDPDGVGHPAAQLLNITPLLPLEIRQLADLPPLHISRQFVGQPRTGFRINAFVYLTEPLVRFRDTFIAEFDVPILEGVDPGETLGCVPDPANLIAQEVMTNVSELYVTTDINGDNLIDFVDMPTNVGCINPTRTQQPRISVVPFNLTFSQHTYGPTIMGPNKVVTEGNDAVFARLVQSLYNDLEFVRRELACTSFDTNGDESPPITTSVCNTLLSKWQNGLIKLNKCIDAAFKPKSSKTNETCNSAITQITNYRSSIPATTPPRDIANRVGELKVRVDVLLNLINTRMLPSMTTNGFCREQVPLPATCTNPWE